jgi:hypothetical protein
MTNAKEELLAKLKTNNLAIKCAYIRTDRNSYWDNNDNYIQPAPILLREGHSIGEYEEFLHKLDFEYDSGYGGQELYGTVWLMEEGTWLERGEYDGSEWWNYQRCPKVLEELKTNKK